MDRIAVVTGTSSGIGQSTALAFARAGLRVVATVRLASDKERLEARARDQGVAVDVRVLDVTDQGSVDACVASTLRDHGRIDVLVNNAGAGSLGTVEQLPEEALRRTIETNFFGVWRVTRAVLPSMRAARSGRIISVTSIGGLIGQPFNDAYCAAKFAVEGMMESLAPVVRRLGIYVSIVEPGPVKTEFTATVQRDLGTSPRPEIDAYRPLLQAYLDATAHAYAGAGQSPDEVADVILQAATADSPHLRYPTSSMVHSIVARKYVDPTGDSILTLTGARLP
jgi:NAD(P)-dependent dehydrogenase (short-subunit alcohol dehydrogenase family)